MFETTGMLHNSTTEYISKVGGQAHPDKMLHFQGLYDFRRDFPPFLNDCKTIENTGQTGFFGFTGDSSQIVVMQLPVAEKLFQE